MISPGGTAHPLPAASRPPQSVLPCELREFWTAGVRVHATEGAGLPQPTLPDGRWVVCIPARMIPANILPREWRAIVAAARLARGPLIDHAYERTLENLQEWKEIGRDVMRRYVQRSALLSQKGTLEDGEDPFSDCNLRVPLMSWIAEWASELYREDFPDFRPSKWLASCFRARRASNRELSTSAWPRAPPTRSSTRRR